MKARNAAGLSVLCLAVFTFAADGDWKPLFNGKDLTGWKTVGCGHWTVEDSVIVGRNDPEQPGNYWLVSREEYDDFALRLKVWITPNGNSGIAIRDPSHARGPKTPAHNGYEIQIHDRKGSKMPTGSIYLIQPAVDGLHRSDQWNDIEIQCKGPRIQVWVNGAKAAETEHTRSLRGTVGLQIHDRDAVVKFKDIAIKKL